MVFTVLAWIKVFRLPEGFSLWLNFRRIDLSLSQESFQSLGVGSPYRSTLGNTVYSVYLLGATSLLIPIIVIISLVVSYLSWYFLEQFVLY